MQSIRNLWQAEKWQADLLFNLGFQGWLVHIGVVTMVMAMLLAGYPDALWPYPWYGAMVVLSLLLAALSRCYVRRQPMDEAQARTAGFVHTFLTGMVGIVWGLGAFGAATGTFQQLLIYSLALGGSALGAVSSQHVLPRSCLVSLWTSVPLLALAHLFHEPRFHATTNAGMVLLYTVILSILMVRMKNFLSRNVALTAALDARVSELTEMGAELEKARQQAVNANLSKSRFLAFASHDLRQPIHAIGLFTACLREMQLGREAMHMADNIDRSVEAVIRLVRSLLDISRLDIGGITVKPEAVGLHELLAAVVQQNKEAAQARGCLLRLAETRAWGRTDPVLLSNMVQNLVSNAIKYGEGAPVLIGVRRRGGRLAIQVRDWGPGIAPADRERIFDEFYRSEWTQGSSADGLGLGLAIVRRLAPLLGLEVDMSSRPGRGTCVTILGIEPASAHGAAPRNLLGSHPLAGTTICLVDDNPEVLEASSLLLRRWGCDVVAIAGVPERATGCDIIVSDFDLGPGLDGLGMIDAIRETEGWAVPAAILSGRSDPAALVRLEGSGLPLLRKPVRPAELRAVLTRFALQRGGERGGENADTPALPQ